MDVFPQGSSTFQSSSPSKPSTDWTDLRGLTANDVIRYHRDRLFYVGDLGWMTNFPNPHEIFGQKSETIVDNNNEDVPKASIFDVLAEDEGNIDDAIEALNVTLRRLHHQERALHQSPEAVADAEELINEELRRKGRSERYIGGRPLGQKIREVIMGMVNHRQAEANYVSVSVVRPTAIATLPPRSEWLGVNLPTNGDAYNIRDIHEILRSVMKGDCLERCMEAGDRPEDWDAAKLDWKYQLLPANNSQLLSKSSAKLAVDDDWETLKKMLMTKESKPPLAVLTCDGLVATRRPKAKAVGFPRPNALAQEKEEAPVEGTHLEKLELNYLATMPADQLEQWLRKEDYLDLLDDNTFAS